MNDNTALTISAIFILVGIGLVILFTTIGIHSMITGTVNTSFKCIRYSPSGSCSEHVLIHQNQMYKLTLIKGN